VRDGALERLPLRVPIHQVIFLVGNGWVGPGVEHEVVASFALIEHDPVCLYPGGGRGIHLHDGGLTRRNGLIDLRERRVAGGAWDEGFECDLRVDLADRSPNDRRTDEAAHILKFFIEGPGGFCISMPAEEHGGGGEGAAYIAEGIAGVTEAEPVALPLGVLLGVVHEFERHELPPLAVEDDDGVIILLESGI